jgi:lysozyme
MDATTLSLLRAELKRDEGVRLKPYRDSVGKLTIGTGRNLEAIGIRPDENDYLLNNDIACVEAALDAALPWWRTLDTVRQRVLANMCFNLGIGKLLGFKNTLPLIQCGQYEAAARGLVQSLWAQQVGPRAVRLSQAMKTGVMPMPE